MATNWTTSYFQPRELPQPTAQQKARLDRRRRFKWLYVYLPLGLVATVWLGLILGLLWLTIVGKWFAMDTNQEYYRELASGIADVFTILMLTPLMLLCALPIIIAIGLATYRWQQKREEPKQVQLPLFWRIENAISHFQESIASTMSRVARPVISAHATAAFIRTFLLKLREIFSQEIDRYVNDR